MYDKLSIMKYYNMITKMIHIFSQSGEINMTLIIEDETFEETYTCRATNFIGSSEKHITLIIIGMFFYTFL